MDVRTRARKLILMLSGCALLLALLATQSKAQAQSKAQEGVDEVAADMLSNRGSPTPRPVSKKQIDQMMQAAGLKNGGYKPTVLRFELDFDQLCANPSPGEFRGMELDRAYKKVLCQDVDAFDLEGEREFFIARDSRNLSVHKHEMNPKSAEELLSKSQTFQINRNLTLEPGAARSDINHGAIKDEYNSLSAVMVFLLGAVLMTPEDLGGWPQERKDNIYNKGVGYAWSKNIRQGLVVDKDPAFINYALHPYSGASYYMIARKNGMSPLASFGFSFMMSVQWELLETIGEPLSIQDLIATPVIGSLIGELFFQIYEAIHANPDFEESVLGKITLAIVDPIASLSRATDNLAKRVWGRKATGRFEIFVDDAGPTHSMPGGGSARDIRWQDSTMIGGRISFRF